MQIAFECNAVAVAAQYGKEDALKTLLQWINEKNASGSNDPFLTFMAIAGAQSHEHRNALHLAIQGNHLGCMELLLEGSNTHAKSTTDESKGAKKATNMLLSDDKINASYLELALTEATPQTALKLLTIKEIPVTFECIAKLVEHPKNHKIRDEKNLAILVIQLLQRIPKADIDKNYDTEVALQKFEDELRSIIPKSMVVSALIDRAESILEEENKQAQTNARQYLQVNGFPKQQDNVLQWYMCRTTHYDKTKPLAPPQALAPTSKSGTSVREQKIDATNKSKGLKRLRKAYARVDNGLPACSTATAEKIISLWESKRIEVKPSALYFIAL